MEYYLRMAWYFGIPRIVWIIAGVVLLEIVIVYIIIPGFSWWRDRCAPIVRVRARVVLKHQREAEKIPGWLLTLFLALLLYRISYQRQIDDQIRYLYIITFETDRYERREFQVPEEAFALYEPGDQGELVYQGSRLISFTREQVSQRC